MIDTKGKFITRPVGDPKLLQPMIETVTGSTNVHLLSLLLSDPPALHK